MVNIYDLDYVITDNTTNYQIVHHVHTTHRAEVISIEAFTNQKYVHPNFCWKQKWEWEKDEKRWKAAVERYNLLEEPPLETHFHANVWSFYKFIDWDYKKKRWGLL